TNLISAATARRRRICSAASRSSSRGARSVTREEFAEVCAYLAAAIARPIPRAQAEVYFDLLGDLPAPVLRAAARQALAASAYPRRPRVGVVRRLAVEQLQDDLPPAAEAYRLVLRVVNARRGDRGRLLDDLPEPVRQAALAMGLDSIGDSTEPETCRAQFTRA